MRIAVQNSDGIQDADKGKLRYYYVVVDEYDFSGNTATEVTSMENGMLLWEHIPSKRKTKC